MIDNAQRSKDIQRQPIGRPFGDDTMKRAEGKAARINQIERLLWSHPEGLSRSEVARRIGVHRSVITKYLESRWSTTGRAGGT